MQFRGQFINIWQKISWGWSDKGIMCSWSPNMIVQRLGMNSFSSVSKMTIRSHCQSIFRTFIHTKKHTPTIPLICGIFLKTIYVELNFLWLCLNQNQLFLRLRVWETLTICQYCFLFLFVQPPTLGNFVFGICIFVYLCIYSCVYLYDKLANTMTPNTICATGQANKGNCWQLNKLTIFLRQQFSQFSPSADQSSDIADFVNNYLY